MSSIESASMPGTEVSEKTPVDFGTKAVSLKAQTDSARLLQNTSQIRSVSAHGNIRPTLALNTTLTSTPVLSSIAPPKAVVTRVAATSAESNISVMGSLTRPPLPATAVSSVSHVTTSYHVPRGSVQVSNITSRQNQGRSFVTLQPVGMSSAPTTGTSFVPSVRTSSPSTTAPRVPSPMQQSSNWSSNPANNVITVPRCISPITSISRACSIPSRTLVSTSKPLNQQQIHRTTEAPRPLLLHAPAQKPLHISTDKSIKVPSVTQVLPLRPPSITNSGFIGQKQGSTIVQSAVSSTTVLTTPVRLNVSNSQPPLISTQRVAMSATPGTVLASRITVPTVTTGTAQAVTLSGQPRIPSALGQGTVIAASSRVGSNNAVSQTTSVIPAQTRLVAGQNTIIATPARIGTQIVGAQPAVLTATARIASAGTTVLSTSKPTMISSQTAVMTTATRMPVTGVSNHQPTTTRVMTSTTNSNLTRFTVSTAMPSTRSTTSITSQITAATTTSRLSSTPSQSTGIVVHPQIMVNATKSLHGANHLTGSRPLITQALHGPIQITQSPVNIASSKVITQPSQNALQTTITTTVASKPITTRPVAVVASQSISIAKIFPQSSGTTTTVADSEVSASQSVQPPSSSVYIHRTLSSPGLVCTASSLASTNAPTLSTYTLPGGASYFYEAPSGYQLATDAPLVARPLSPDTPLVSRQLSSEGPLIARPFTPGSNTFVSQASNSAGSLRSNTISGHGLIAAPQHMRFNSVMIVDQAAVTVQPSYSSENSTLMISESPLTSVSKLNSSPRPSILRKRDNEASPAKATKNLTPVLSSTSVSRSASPSPPSLHVDTNQQSNDHGPSSNGSTTISATSSPGPDDPAENIMPVIKTEFNEDVDRPPVEMSPRKKPRKQLLNDANDAIEMEFISDERIKKEREDEDVPADKVYVVKRPNVSLLHSYKHNWKSRHNHFLRYSDVKPKDERRPTVTDLANQKQVVQKVNGWKIYHLSTQMEDLVIRNGVTRFGSFIQHAPSNGQESLQRYREDVNRVNDLIMGNIQRSKVIKDQMQEAKTQMMKVFDHKVHVSEIISRCASKRNFKKRDKVPISVKKNKL
ncbi:sin3a-associated protein sap130, putative [Pediculus humanus corporis]|uniref:Sin3a-associated protein sap130, putative n=1 Tax=Pediculus humanus subsp. corporis TaxID=121224 RepID=E0VFN7_PEDHC|nr:sin3a-associated protein sap130, putative [Pediculus humanus corporis]EEB12193.1 sin3a-associated protein sap130, putative [Pediculus humanus corporis]